jgi:hypothetical protein
MPLTEVQIISGALMKLGKKPISALGQDDMSIAAQQQLEQVLPTRIAQNSWRFATRIVQLAQNVLPPPVSYWQYSYQLPGDFLKYIRQYPMNWAFELYNNSLMYSNLNGPIFMEYCYLPQITALPDWFTQYLIWEVAAQLALSNAQNAQYAPFCIAQRDIELAKAMAADAQNRPQTPLASSPIISNRFVGTWIGG